MTKYLVIALLLASPLQAMRNPFYSPDSPDYDDITLKLRGTIRHNKNYAAILDDGDETHVVFCGGKVKDFYINDIGGSFVVASNNGETQKLVIE